MHNGRYLHVYLGVVQMTAKPGDLDVISRNARRLQSGIAAGLGAVLALLIVYQVASAEVLDPRMESACKMPRYEGEMTVATVINGKLICWRWQ